MTDDQSTPGDDQLAALAEEAALRAEARDDWVFNWAEHTAGHVAKWLSERWPDRFPSLDDDEDARMEMYDRLVAKVQEHLDSIAEDVFMEAAHEAGIDTIEAFAYLEALRERE